MSNHPATDAELLARVEMHASAAAVIAGDRKALGGFEILSGTATLNHLIKANAAMQELHNRLRGVPVATHKYNEPD